MRRQDVARCIAARLDPSTHVVFCGLGTTSRAWRELETDIPVHYCSDPMGLSAGTALGFALARPERQVLHLQGDGDLVMNLGILLAIAEAAPENLRLVVFDNGRYETGGGQPRPGAGAASLGSIADGAGMRWTKELSPTAGIETVEEALDELLSTKPPALLVVPVEPEPSPYGGPGERSGAEERFIFQTRLYETEGRNN